MDEQAIVYREMQPDDVPAALALRNEVFSRARLTAADWARDEMTVSTAFRGSECVGAIPLVPRDLLITPDRAIRAPFENAVGTREDLRSRGIGSGMIASARDFMHGRADGLFVYRGAERSAGYRFYVKSGHHDLLYTHLYQLSVSPPPEGSPEGWPPLPLAALRVPSGRPRPSLAEGQGVTATVVPITAEVIDSYAERLLPLFLSTYGAFAGYPRRHRGYWRRALCSSIFAAIPRALFLILVGDERAPRGYAITGVSPSRSDSPLEILEMAAQGADLAVATEVLQAVVHVAAERSPRVAIRLAPDDPFVPALTAVGFATSPRSTVVMGQLIDLPEFFQRHRAASLRMGGVGLRVWTPVQDHVLAAPHDGCPTLTLEMKEEAVHRWLLGRADLSARLREGTVTAYGADLGAVRAACAAIPYQPWAYHQLDWI